MTSFAEYQPQYYFQNDSSYFSGDMNRQLDAEQHMYILKKESPVQLPPSPQSDNIYSGYQPLNVNDSSLYINTGFNSSPSDFNVNNIPYIADHLTESLNCNKLYLPNYDQASLKYQTFPEMAADTNTISWNALYTSPQQSSEFECYQPVANGYQFAPLNQTTYSNDGGEPSSCSSMDPTCITGIFSTGSPVNMYPTQSIPISSSNSASSSSDSYTPPSTKNITKAGRTSHKTNLKTSKNAADSKMEKLLKNREAAAKCRKKKREYLKTTKTLIESVNKENAQLEECILRLREEIVDMKLLLANINH